MVGLKLDDFDDTAFLETNCGWPTAVLVTDVFTSLSNSKNIEYFEI